MHEFEQMEDAILSALDSLTALGLRTLDSYSGQLDVEELEEVTIQFPCIYVVMTLLGLTENNRNDRYSMSILLLVGDRNMRGSAAAARGDVSSPGVYALLEAARARLHRKKVLSGWPPLMLQSEVPLVYAPQSSICIYSATYAARTVA
jgi:phage gp37-like protein